MGVSWATVLLWTNLIGISSASPLRLPVSVPKNLPRAETSSDPSCPDGFFCEQSDCPDDVVCPEGEQCVNFEGHYACAPPEVTFCALNPSDLEVVGCDSGLCCHGNCYQEDAVCCDFPAVKCTVGELCNACSPDQKCGDSECVDKSDQTTTTTSSSTTTTTTITAAPPMETTSSASTTESTSSSTDTSSTTSRSDEPTSTSSSSETSTSETSTTSKASSSSTPSSSTSGQPTPTTLAEIDDFSATDCLSDNNDNRILVGDDDESSSDMTPEECIKLAQDGGWRYAGVEYGSECYVGNTLHTDDKDSKDGCTMPCSGDEKQQCGGEGLIQIYEDSTWKDPTLEDLADGIRQYNASIAHTREAVSTYHDHLESLQDLMDSSKRRVKRADSPWEDIELQVQEDRDVLDKVLEELAAARSNGKDVLTRGRRLDTIFEEDAYVPFSALDDFESTALDLLEEVNNVIRDLDYNLSQLASAVASGVQPAIEVGKSLLTIESAISAIGTPAGLAIGAATRMFLVMTGLLALFVSDSEEPTPTIGVTTTVAATTTGTPDPTSTGPCVGEVITTPVVIFTKPDTSLAEFKGFVGSLPVDSDAVQLTEKWMPNYMYAENIDYCTWLELSANPLVESFAVDAEIEAMGFASEGTGAKKRSAKAEPKAPTPDTEPSFEAHNATAEDGQSSHSKRGHLQWMSTLSQYKQLTGSYYAFDDLVYNDISGRLEDQPIVYIVDMGFNNAHAEYADRVVAQLAASKGNAGFELVAQQPVALNHGTCMTALAAGAFTGMAKKARIVTVDFRNPGSLLKRRESISQIFFLFSEIYRHAKENNGFGNSVVSMSFLVRTSDYQWTYNGVEPPDRPADGEGTTDGEDTVFDTVFNWFWDKGIVTVTASGNHELQDDPSAKKSLDSHLPRSIGGTSSPLIVVRNAQADNTRNPTSTYRVANPEDNPGILSLYNLGTDIECAAMNGGYKQSTGSSLSSASTAGLVAYYLSQPDLKAKFNQHGLEEFVMNVKHYLIDTAEEYKGTFDDGIPRAALGEVVGCQNGAAGRPEVKGLRTRLNDHTLRTLKVTKGQKIILDPMMSASMPELELRGVGEEVRKFRDRLD
ncbi:hypothetical protein BJX70DRAFT_399072 [Aspergillus crustosus]